MEHNYAFTMELSVEAPIPEWNSQSVRMSLEQDVVYTQEGCWPMNGRQTKFHLI